MEAQKDEFGRYLNYTSPTIEGYEEDVKSVVETWASAVLSTKTDSEKRTLIPQFKSALHLVVDFVMANLPEGVERVDGKVILPILEQVAKDKLAELPVETSEEV